MKQLNVNSNDLVNEFKKTNDFKHLGFNDADIAKLKRDVSREDNNHDQLDMGIAVPYTYLVNRRKQKTAKILLKFITEKLSEDGYSVVCDGFKSLNSVKIYNKDSADDVFPVPNAQVLTFTKVTEILSETNWTTYSGLATLWFIYLYIKYIETMDGDETPFLYCKDLHVGGQPIIVRRSGTEIHFKAIHIFSPTPTKFSDELIAQLAMVW